MCGRYARVFSVRTFAERLHAQGTLTLTESYNVAPTQAVLLARNAEDGRRELAALHWGLIPAWSKEPKTPYSTINARAETVAGLSQCVSPAPLSYCRRWLVRIYVDTSSVVRVEPSLVLQGHVAYQAQLPPTTRL